VSETWNREELYAEIWEKPLVKVGAKYNISAVALGKVCRKLQIPLPGRGYWTKKEFGKPVEQTPLPIATNLPVVRKMKEEYLKARKEDQILVDESDPELVRIANMRTTLVPVNEKPTLHKTVSETKQVMKEAHVDSRGGKEVKDGTVVPYIVSSGSEWGSEYVGDHPLNALRIGT